MPPKGLEQAALLELSLAGSAAVPGVRQQGPLFFLVSARAVVGMQELLLVLPREERQGRMQVARLGMPSATSSMPRSMPAT